MASFDERDPLRQRLMSDSSADHSLSGSFKSFRPDKIVRFGTRGRGFPHRARCGFSLAENPGGLSVDPVTHVLVGAAVAKSYRVPRIHFWTLAVLAELPDLDVFFRALGFHGLMSTHRSWTHSLLAVGLLGAALWVVMRALRRRDPCPVAPYLLAAGSHTVCDWMTSYGTPLFWPFSTTNFSLDWVSNLSLGPLSILAAGLLALKVWKDRDRWIIPSLWGALSLFLALSIILHARALAYANSGDAAYALPDLVNPLHWRVIDENRSMERYDVISVDLLSGHASPVGGYPMPPDSPWVRASLSDPRVKVFLRNDRWPVARVLSRPPGATVEWGNLLFFWSGRMRGMLEVDCDAGGRVVSVRRNQEAWQ
jgi:membrane-bound metal-dependent hydrolase YbcI (DUF457 family)